MAITRIFNGINIRVPGGSGGRILPATIEYKFITTMEKLLKRHLLSDEQHMWAHLFRQTTVDVFNVPPPPAA